MQYNISIDSDCVLVASFSLEALGNACKVIDGEFTNLRQMAKVMNTATIKKIFGIEDYMLDYSDLKALILSELSIKDIE